jgi:hypothetical protein
MLRQSGSVPDGSLASQNLNELARRLLVISCRVGSSCETTRSSQRHLAWLLGIFVLLLDGYLAFGTAAWLKRACTVLTTTTCGELLAAMAILAFIGVVTLSYLHCHRASVICLAIDARARAIQQQVPYLSLVCAVVPRAASGQSSDEWTLTWSVRRGSSLEAIWAFTSFGMV